MSANLKFLISLYLIITKLWMNEFHRLHLFIYRCNMRQSHDHVCVCFVWVCLILLKYASYSMLKFSFPAERSPSYKWGGEIIIRELQTWEGFGSFKNRFWSTQNLIQIIAHLKSWRIYILFNLDFIFDRHGIGPINIGLFWGKIRGVVLLIVYITTDPKFWFCGARFVQSLKS